MTQETPLMPAPADREAVEQLSHSSELEAALSSSDAAGQATLADTRSRVAQIHERLSRAMAEGAGPDEFAVLRALAQACESAQQILDATVAGKQNRPQFP